MYSFIYLYFNQFFLFIYLFIYLSIIYLFISFIYSCSIGGLVIARHNEIRDKLLYQFRCAFTSEYVHAKSIIHQGRTRSDQEIRQGSVKDKETRGDVMFRGLWYRQVNAIIYVKL